eukprot:228487_1
MANKGTGDKHRQPNEPIGHHAHDDNDHNINKMCLCGSGITKCPFPFDQCKSCCNVNHRRETAYYWCNSKQCTFRQMTAQYFIICTECYERVNNSNDDANHSFVFCKVASMVEQMRKETTNCQNNDERRRYMYWMHFLFYTNCIAKMKNAFVNESEYKEIQDIFKTFYSGIMEDINHSIDLMELGVTRDQFRTEEKRNHKRKEWVKMNTISSEWKMLNKEEKTIESDDCDFAKCGSCKRIQFVMACYRHRFLNRFGDGIENSATNDGIEYIDVFENVLERYNATDLLNDYFHIETCHVGDKNLRNCLHGDEDCCSLLWRKERASMTTNPDREIFGEYLKVLDSRRINILDISSKIHLFINHFTLKQQTNSKIRSLARSRPSKYNKFVNEIDCEVPEACMIDNELGNDLHTNGLPIMRCNMLINDLNDNEYDSDAIIDDLTNDNDPCNNYEHSTIYNSFLKSKYFIKIIKKRYAIKPNDDDQVTTFMLGRYRMMYWKYWKNKSDNNTLYVNKMKYRSLKEESINNMIYNIDINTFQDILQKAVTYTLSCKGRSIRANDMGGNNLLYEIPMDLPITISHLMVLIMYSDFSDLQYYYKKMGCREYHPNEDSAVFVQRHQEIAHWYKLLNEAIGVYGTRVTPGQVFYTGINIRVLFDTYTPYFRCPFSTTIDWNVANRFSEGIGIVIKLQPEIMARDRYFNVEWFSNYKEERERLFSFAKHLRITDIQYPIKMETQYNKLYVNAFRLWSAIFAGYYFVFEHRKLKKTEKMIVNLILNYKDNNGLDIGNESNYDDVPIYMQQLFYHLVHSVCQGNNIRLIPSEFLQLEKSLQNQLLSFKPLTLYPFLASLLDTSVLNIECLEEYIWILTEKQLEKLKCGQKDVYIMTGEQPGYQYKMKDTHNRVTFDMGIRDNASNIYTGFTLRIKELSGSSTVSGMFSIAVEELKWAKNGIHFSNLEEENVNGYFFFKSQLLNNLKTLTLRMSVECLALQLKNSSGQKMEFIFPIWKKKT